MNNKKILAIILCIVIALVATFLGGKQNYVGAPMIGLFIGMLIYNLMPDADKDFKSGTSFAGKKFLNWGIILAGATLNFNEVVGFGAKAIPLIVFNICLSFFTAFMIGRKLGLNDNINTLVGGGTSICGGTAIATMATIIKAHEDEIAYAMTAIFVFDILAALAYPYLSTAMGLTQNQFAIFAGTAINDTSSVAAAEATYNALQGLDLSSAITVKLTRTTMLIPLAIIVTMITIKKQSKAVGNEQASLGQTILKIFPWFIVIFLGMAILNTFGLFDLIPGAGKFFKKGYKFLITAALAGVGFKIKFKDLFTKGAKPLILGGCTWFAVFLSSLLFINLFAGYVG